MHDPRPLCERQQGQRLRHHLVERLGAQTATDDQQPQRSAASGKPLRWRRLLRERRAQRIADPLRLLQHVGKRREDAISDACQHLVGHAGHRVLLVQHQRLAEQHTHEPPWESDITTEPDQHVGPHPSHHLQALPERLEQAQRKQRQSDQAFAANPRKINALEGKAPRRHDLALHPAGRSQPMYAPSPLMQGLRHGQAGEDVAPGAAGHDQGALRAHTRPPRMSCRFSTSTRRTTATATRLIRMAEPP
jgi:hypothetical protein